LLLVLALTAPSAIATIPASVAIELLAVRTTSVLSTTVAAIAAIVTVPAVAAVIPVVMAVLALLARSLVLLAELTRWPLLLLPWLRGRLGGRSVGWGGGRGGCWCVLSRDRGGAARR
jgi:hypothetical protein